MKQYMVAVDQLLSEGYFILIYTEQSVWWNYRKPKPLKARAFQFASRNNVPVLPCFITMKDMDRWILRSRIHRRECVEKMMADNAEL